MYEEVKIQGTSSGKFIFQNYDHIPTAWNLMKQMIDFFGNSNEYINWVYNETVTTKFEKDDPSPST